MPSDDKFPRRIDDLAVAELVVEFREFLARYDRDQKTTTDWRDAHWLAIDANTKLLNEIAPNYRRGILVVSTIFVGTIAYVLKAVLEHFKWQ